MYGVETNIILINFLKSSYQVTLRQEIGGKLEKKVRGLEPEKRLVLHLKTSRDTWRTAWLLLRPEQAWKGRTKNSRDDGPRQEQPGMDGQRNCWAPGLAHTFSLMQTLAVHSACPLTGLMSFSQRVIQGPSLTAPWPAIAIYV